MRLAYKAAGASGKSKPFGSIGVEIFRSVGTVAATDPAQAKYNGTITKSPFRQSFAAEDQGKLCTYFARFVTRSGPDGQAQVGPWSAALNVHVV
jgi:triphosphoribosyl-dephospho-CoA synthetase